MKKKTFGLFVIIILIALLLTACDNSYTSNPIMSFIPSDSLEPSVEPSPVLSENTEFKINYDSSGNIDYSATWPDKTVLVWAYSDYYQMLYYYMGMLSTQYGNIEKYTAGINNEIIAEYNNYLISQGCNYVVKFISEMSVFDQVRKDISDKVTISPGQLFLYYQPWLRQLKQNKEQVDIISSGISTGYQDPVKDSPTYGQRVVAAENPDLEAVQDGLVSDITEYITNDSDTRLYDALPEYIWNLTMIDGRIYGVYNDTPYAKCSQIKFNESVMQALGLKKEDVDTLEEINIVLANVYSQKKEEIESNQFILVINNTNEDTYDLFADIHTDDNNISYKYDNEGNAYALNKYADEKYVEFMESMSLWNSKGYFTGKYFTEDYYDDASRAVINSGNWFMKLDYELLSYTNKADTISINLNDWVFNDNFSNMISISSWSENKDMAYDLLCRVFTDQYLSNLIRYGIKGKDYTVSNGIIKMQNSRFENNTAPSYMLIVEPCRADDYTVSEKLEVVSRLKPPAYQRFDSDTVTMGYDITRFNELILQADKLWVTHPNDFSIKLAEIMAELNRLGYADFINKVNNQLREYMSSLSYLKTR
jgi:hypothetical protein